MRIDILPHTCGRTYWSVVVDIGLRQLIHRTGAYRPIKLLLGRTATFAEAVRLSGTVFFPYTYIDHVEDWSC